MNASTHEVVAAFEQAALGLHRTLCDMLNEHPSHRTERRGCGFTQATRFLSTFVNQPRSIDEAFDFGLLAEWPKQQTEALARQALSADWRYGWRNLDRCDADLVERLLPKSLADSLRRLPVALAEIEAKLEHQESKLLMSIIRQILVPSSTTSPNMPEMRTKPEIGSCSQAEEFFLEIAHGRIRRGGRVNLFVGDDAKPILVEKMGLGESHSAMAVAPVSVCDVTLPPGSLFALQYDDDAASEREIGCGRIMRLSTIRQARFLRLTTLAVSPQARRRAFSSQLEAQIRADMLSPTTTTIEHLRGFAQDRIERG